MLPKVSIVIPVYNGVNYMREAIDSALNQTYENCEVIVVNDGSTDETEQIALSYGNRIRYFAKENGGVSTALNLGIEKMEGEYFQYLPHDDMLHLQKIEKNIAAIQKSGDNMSIVWSGWNYHYMDERGEKKACIFYDYLDDEKLTNSVFPLLFGIVNTVTVLINKKYFERKGNFNTKLYTSQDYDMWFRTFIDQRTIYLDEELVDYRMHGLQGTQAEPEFMQNCMELSEKVVSKLSKTQVTNLFGSRYRFLFYMLDYYKRMGWESCYKKIYQSFRECEEPAEGETDRKNLYRYMMSLGNGKTESIVLYCAGKNSRNLLRELQLRDIHVRAFSDSNKNMEGMTIDGIPCVSPDTIDQKKDLVIVTKDFPESVIFDLRKQGIESITSYEEIGSRLYDTLPVKHKVLEK